MPILLGGPREIASMGIKLDADQQKAVEHFEGPALVVAGPGSGKTTVIKERILHLIREHKVDPEQILAIAFTNAAADEMEKRLSNEPVLSQSKPKICTLHVFGKDILTEHYELSGFSQSPDNVWDADDIEQIINREKAKLKRKNNEDPVAIYKFEGLTTGRCYIGQTTDLCRREKEHRTHSSNRGLREALQKCDEHFAFKEIKWVEGWRADGEEEDQIKSRRNRSVVDLNQQTARADRVNVPPAIEKWLDALPEPEQVERENSDILLTIYKIKSPTAVTCYIGQTTENEALSKAREEGRIGQFPFEVIAQLPSTKAPSRIAREIEKHKDWAVFNRQYPLEARDSNRRRIEIFCRHFKVSYAEILEQTQKFKGLMEKFDSLREDIERAKRQVTTGVFEPDEIKDPVFRAFAKRYEEEKEKAGAIDFLDMLILFAHLLETNPDLLHEYREKYRYVFVDEFQDISPVDFRLIKLFPENLFALGDDDQAIYGFRGGDSEIMRNNFGNWENVKKYEITRNYRSTATIVRHAKALIEHNTYRISKNLRAENSVQSRVEVLKTSPDTVKEALLKELLPIVMDCQTHVKENMPRLENLLFKELTRVGVLARNWYEVRKIQSDLQCPELLAQGFKVNWLKSKDDPSKKIMFLRRGIKEVEVRTIHSAKGREWEKVILLVNTMVGKKGTPYESLPDSRNDLTDERCLFYVAVTRAKQELIVLGRKNQLGWNCQFVPEFQKVPQIETVEAELGALKSKLKKQIADTAEAARKQYEPELNRLLRAATEAENAAKKAAMQLQTGLPTELKAANEALLEGLIPILDGFESVVENANQNVETVNDLDDFAAFTASVRHAQKHLLDSLKIHGLKPIEVSLGEIFNQVHHEEVSPAIYSDEVSAGRVARKERRGYLLHDRVIRKTQVGVSKGQNIKTPEGLNRIVEIYLDRLIAFRHGPKYDLDKPTIRRKMTKYLAELDEESQKKIASAATIDTVQYINEQRFGNYCVGQHTTHMCTDVVFQNFWERMWEVVEQSRKTPEPQMKLKKIANQARAWDEIATAYESGSPVKGRITERIKGGFRVSVGSLRGFLPASQVELRSIQHLEPYVEQTLEMKVIEINKPRNNIVFSRRAWLEEERTKLLNTLEIGQGITGTVKNITTFGAFVDLGGVDGLLHKSEMAWKRIEHPSEAVSVGEKIEVKVIKIDWENEKISLSLKHNTSDPWENVEEKYPVGSRVQGTVINIVHYGAFFELEEGVEGLIHVSEMSWTQRDVEPSHIVSKGDKVEAMVLEISKGSRRISLSIKQCQQNPFEVEAVEPSTDDPAAIAEIESDISSEPPEPTIVKPIEEIEEAKPPSEDPSLVAEAEKDYLDESIDSIAPERLQEVGDSLPPIPQDSAEILKTHIQALKPEPLEPEISSEPPEAVNNTSQLTPQESKDILNKHIGELKVASEPMTSEAEPAQLPTDEPSRTLEAEKGTSVNQTKLMHLDSLEGTPDNSFQIESKNLSEDEIQDVKKGFGDYLRQFGRFVTRKLK